MTTMSYPLDPNESDAQAILNVGLVAAKPTLFRDGDVAAFVLPPGSKVELVDLIEQSATHQSGPERKAGAFTVHDAESFVAYMAKHVLPESEVWSDAVHSRIVGVINAHSGISSDGADFSECAGWGDHRVTYGVKKTPAWEAWIARDGNLMDQAGFAELIEDRLVDIIRPDAADMLELAQNFEANIGVRFESSRLLSSGERQLTYKEDVQASAGRSGQLEIPRDFELGLIPFEGASGQRITARFRYRITDGALRIGYKLDRPEDVLRDAFESVVQSVAAGVTVKVYRGVSA